MLVVSTVEVMMLRRFPTLLVVLLLTGVLVAVAIPAGADRDDNMIVGRANGGKAYNTSLYSTNNTATLSLHNRNGGGAPALSLHSNSGPAMAINSNSRILNLNADYTDGWSANALARAAGCTTDDAPDLQTSYDCTITLIAPAAGWITLSGSAQIDNGDTSTRWVTCEYLGITVHGDTRWVDIDAGKDGICASHAIAQVDAGTHNIKFSVTVENTALDILAVGAHATFVTHDGSGARPGP
jgi:hypothetical protein